MEERQNYFYSAYPTTKEAYAVKLKGFIREREHSLALEHSRHKKAVKRLEKQLDDYRQELRKVESPIERPFIIEQNISPHAF